METNKNDLLNQIQFEFSERVKARRSVVLDVFEGLFGHTSHWDMVRKKLLHFLGTSGIEGDLSDILNDFRDSNHGHK